MADEKDYIIGLNEDELVIEPICPECGEVMEAEVCDACCGDCAFHDCGDPDCPRLHKGECPLVPCQVCNGRGWLWTCLECEK